MTLCIDIGNSNVACGIYHETSWKYHWRMATGVDRTHDEYELLMRNFLDADGIKRSQISHVAISSVVPGLNEPFSHAIRRLFGFAPFWVKAGVDLGLEILIDNPKELGPDLMANAVAGFQKYGKPCIVVDFGTALSFTAVDLKHGTQRGHIAGVAIAPGLGSAIKALSGNTAQLPYVTLTAPPKAIGTNTINSIQSGIIFGYVGLVENLVKRMSTELSESPAVIATGGMSDIIATQTEIFTSIDPWLTLDGLRLILERNNGGIS